MELKQDEKAMKEKLPDDCAKVLANKRVLVYKEMLEAIAYEDLDLPLDMCTGFDLMGRLKKSHVFPTRKSFCTLTNEQVRSSACLTRRAIWNKDPEIEAAVYKAIQNERERGWLRGPFDIGDLDERASLTRRFGVNQTTSDGAGGQTKKVRPIDNFTESLINLTNSSDESIPVRAVDLVAAALVYRLTLANLSGIKESLGLRTIDLRKADKQLPISEDSLLDSHLCVRNPHTGRQEAYQSLILPFGARAAVQGFYRCSFFIWKLGVQLLQLHWTLFFDDFLVVGRSDESSRLQLICNSLFALLGWEVSEEKDAGFEACAKALGLMIDLSDSLLYKVTIKNTLSRSEELVAASSGKGKL